MGERRRLAYLFLVMTVVAGVTGAMLITMVYHAELDWQRGMLEGVVKSQTELIDELAQLTRSQHPALTREQVSKVVQGRLTASYSEHPPFGTTGEVLVGKAQNGGVVVLVSTLRPTGVDTPVGTKDPQGALPLRRALAGESGTVIARDYMGATVLAAYKPLPLLGLGVVAKINLAEIRAPFIQAVCWSAVVALLAMALAAWWFTSITTPLIRKLAASQKKYRQLAESTNTVSWEFDLLADRWTYIAPQVEHLLGYAPTEWLNVQWWVDHLHAEDRSWAAEYCATQAVLGTSHSLDYRFIAKDDRVVWIHEEVDVEVVEGKAVKLRGVMLDVTERKLAEEKLEALNAELSFANEQLVETNEELVATTEELSANSDELSATNEELNSTNEELAATNQELRTTNEALTYANDQLAAVNEQMSATTEELIATNDELLRAQAEMKEGKDRLNLALVSAQMGVWHWDIPSNIRSFDEQTCHLLGIDPALFTGVAEEFFQVLHTADREKVSAALKRTLESNAPYEPEYRVVWADGSVHHISARGELVRDAAGQPQRINGIVWDNTESKLGEEKLERQNEFVQSVLNSLTHPFYVVNVDDYSIAMANPAAGIDVLTAGQKCHWYAHGQNGPCGSLSHPCPLDIMRATRHPVTVEHIHHDAAGNPRNVEIHAYPIFDGQGRLAQMIEYCLDVTDRKRAEDAVYKSEEKYRQLVELAREGIWAVDAQGLTTFVNSRMSEILANAQDDYLGKHMSDFVFDEDLAAHNQRMQARQQGDAQTYEQRFRRADGTPCWCLVAATPLLNESGEYVGSFAMLTDITERKRAEAERAELEEYLRQAHKMEAIGTLAGGIAHDFNNLLFAILGYAELVKDDLKPDSLSYANMQALVSAGLRAKGLVQQILTFSRKTRSEPVELELSLIVKEAVNMLRVTQPSSLEIKQRLDPVCSVVLADPTEAHQLLMNLCTNAAQAIGDGPGVIDISLSEIEVPAAAAGQYGGIEAGMYLELVVRDSGPGIPQQTKERIFEPFFTTKEQGKGTGMGLSVVHGIVTKLSGAIVVDSEVGRGTQFKVYLPARPRRSEAEPAENIANLNGSEQVLVIDDEPDVLVVMRHMLTSLGYQVCCCTSAQEALAMLLDNPNCAQIVITDQTMPKLTGVEFTKKLHVVYPDLPVILCTGFSETVNAESAAQLGLTDCLYKPVHKSVLAEAIRRALRSRSTQIGSTAAG